MFRLGFAYRALVRGSMAVVEHCNCCCCWCTGDAGDTEYFQRIIANGDIRSERRDNIESTRQVCFWVDAQTEWREDAHRRILYYIHIHIWYVLPTSSIMNYENETDTQIHNYYIMLSYIHIYVCIIPQCLCAPVCCITDVNEFPFYRKFYRCYNAETHTKGLPVDSIGLMYQLHIAL